ncbi:MAG: stage 0 sporulation family protein [Candidatus Gygaella obscura]|nr:stage 0 sporulation family protein [Candidatus Gygaella obscura]
MEKLIQARLRDAGRLVYCYLPEDFTVKISDWVIVDTDKSAECAQVITDALPASEVESSELPRKISRIATENDLKMIEDNKSKAKNAFSVCEKHIVKHKLDMKLVDAEYTFDRSKIIFYFTADGRVDFRNLLKDLAKIFKTRIELRQIGVRDEAKLFGGIGVCGRKLCCTTFLKDFDPVTIKMAKEQGLPLNPPKISGICGRLMCCLSYEHKCYKELLKKMPREGEKINTANGKGKVIAVSPLKQSVMVELESGVHMEVKV